MKHMINSRNSVQLQGRKPYFAPACITVELLSVSTVLDLSPQTVPGQGSEGDDWDDEYHTTSIWEDENDFDGTL